MTTATQVQKILKITYVLLPLAAGLDKFTHLLTDWTAYLHNDIKAVIDAMLFMKIVGVIEIIAGIIVWARPRIGGYIVMAWLICIALQLIAMGNYYDIAVRDLVMAVGAFSLAKLSAPSVNKMSTTP